jgi:myosin heavy subunit
VKPASVYPIRLSKWHGGLLAGGVLTSSIFLLGNSGILLNSDQKKDRASLQAAAPAVERVAKPLLEKPNRDAEEKSLSEKLLQYEAELQKGRISKQEAMQEANELAKQADELSHHKLEQSQKDATTASQALEKMSQSALEKEGLSQSESGAYKSPEEAQEAEAALQKQIQAIQRQLNEGKGTNGAKLSESEKAALTEKLKQLEHQLELSQKAKEFLDRLSQNPEWKKLQEMMAKSAGMCRNPGSMSDEDLKKMIAALEKMADQYKTDEEISKMLKEMEEALKNAGQGQQLGDMANMLMGLMQSPGMYGNPGPGNGQELYFANLHKIPLSDKPSDIKAKAIPLGVTGDRQQAGSETYIDTKGPSGLGSKTKVPFTAVLQQYRHEAEKALDKDQIPPEDQERVKDYFDSLQENK